VVVEARGAVPVVTRPDPEHERSTTMRIDGSRIAFLVATEGVEQIELTRPWADVEAAGGVPVLVSTEDTEVQGFDHLDKADTFEVDEVVEEVDVTAFDALVLPGGVANPDLLRLHDGAVALVRAFVEGGKPVAAICHAPWMLVESGTVEGRTLTSFPSLRTDVANAGATWVDEEVVIDREGPGPIVTSRNPDDLDAFVRALLSTVEEARAAA
jgi:protease I